MSQETCIHGVDLDIVCYFCSPPFILDVKVTEKLDVKEGLEISNPKAIKKLDLLSIPRREDPVEICEVCGAEFQGLYHCQSIKNIREIGAGDRALAEMQEAEDRRFLAAIEDAVTQVGVAGPIKWSAREAVGIGIIDPERVQKDAEGRTVLVPTSVTGTMKISRFAVSKGQMDELLGVDPESWPDNVEDMDEWEEE
jgi:hypothetical protein